MLADDGWAGQATAVDGASVRCESCGVTAAASTLTVAGLHRLEGASDPDDMAAVVTYRCPSCEVGNALVLGYGPTASGEEADVLLALPDAPAPGEGEDNVT